MRSSRLALVAVLAGCAASLPPPRAPRADLGARGPRVVAGTLVADGLCASGADALLLAADSTLRITGDEAVVLGGAGVASIASSQDPVTLTIDTVGPVWIEVDLNARPLRIAGDVGSLHVRAHGPERLHLGPLLTHGDIVYVTDGDTWIDGEITGVGATGSFLGGTDPGPFPGCSDR